MTRPSAPPPSRVGARPPRADQAGVGRPGGLLLASLTAFVVLVVGQRLLPRHAAEAPPAIPAPAPAPTPAPPPPALPTAPSPAPSPAPSILEAAGPTRHPAARAAAGARPSTDSDAESQSDKDVARQAWRRNLPDLSHGDGKASILIPLKGSIEGASFRVTARPHTVKVTLPKAASMITMRMYRVNRDGFRLLWIDQAEADADPKDGTSIRIGLADVGDPQVEIKDDFVRVTVRRSAEGAPPQGGAPEGLPPDARPPEAAQSPPPPSTPDANAD
jgi:hypothetical protein